MIVKTPTNERTNCSWNKEISVDNTLIKESWMENIVIPMMMRKIPVRLFFNIRRASGSGLKDVSECWARVISASMVSNAIVTLINEPFHRINRLIF